MPNPWLKIPYSDYENHMREIGQEQALNRLTKYYLDKYRPLTFALLGCATGNGLEHVNPEITKEVFAADINREYLKIARERFRAKIRNLKMLHLDINTDELPFSQIDLLIAGLILEYVEPERTLRKFVRALNENGIMALIIQKNKKTSFISKTRYHSLETLSETSREVNEKEVDILLRTMDMELLKREEIALTETKSFISLEYRLKKDGSGSHRNQHHS